MIGRGGLPTCDRFARQNGKCTSALTCKQLSAFSVQHGGSRKSWPLQLGDKNICAESDDGLGPGGKPMCYGQRGQKISFAKALSICSHVGARLCTVEEIKANEAKGTGCSHDGATVWTSDQMCRGGHATVRGANDKTGRTVCAPPPPHTNWH